MRQYPDLEACEKLWKEYHTPPHVIGHCKAVSATGTAIAEKLNENGFLLNIPLIRSAGWLHDIARAEEYHWDRGADIARSLGYDDVADIIEVHMAYQIDSQKEEISETDLVCMADRMVKEDHFVGLSERMDYILEKAKDFPGSEDRIRSAFKEIGVFKKRIEAIIGISVEELMSSE